MYPDMGIRTGYQFAIIRSLDRVDCACRALVTGTFQGSLSIIPTGAGCHARNAHFWAPAYPSRLVADLSGSAGTLQRLLARVACGSRKSNHNIAELFAQKQVDISRSGWSRRFRTLAGSGSPHRTDSHTRLGNASCAPANQAEEKCPVVRDRRR